MFPPPKLCRRLSFDAYGSPAIMSMIVRSGEAPNLNSSANFWDDILAVVVTPGALEEHLQDRANEEDLAMHIVVLSSMLQVNTGLLRIPKVADSFDRATFCLGHLASHAPAVVSQLSVADKLLMGLEAALKSGWKVHHGVGKFAANALTIVATCETAAEGIRSRAVKGLLTTLEEWLGDHEGPRESDQVCDCNCGTKAMSATCWIERLLSKPDPFVEDLLLAHPTLVTLVEKLLSTVRDEGGNPFAITHMLCVPGLPLLLSEAEVRQSIL